MSALVGAKVGFSPARCWLIAHNTLLEAARQRLFHFLLLLAFALVVGARGLRDFNFGAPELKFLADCGFGAMTFFGAALAIAATAQLFFSELENRTVLTLLAKPVWRAEFILGKFFGIALLLAAFTGLLTLLLIAVLWTRETELMREFPDAFAQERAISYATVVVAGVLCWLKLVVLAAFTLLIASYAQTQLFTVVSGFFVLLIGHVQYLAQDAYARTGAGIGRWLGGALASIFPNFQIFTLADTLSAGEAPILGQIGRIVLYGAAYAAVACALAIYSFRRREI